MSVLETITIDGVEYDLPSGGGGIDPSVIADEWDPNTEYLKNEFCFHNGILWCAVRTTYDEPSEDSDDWNDVPLASIVGGIQDNFEYLYFETINKLIIPSLSSTIGIIAASAWEKGIEYHKGDIVIKPFEMEGADYYELWECLIATDSEEPSDDSEYWKHANLVDTVNTKLGTDLGNIDEAGIERIKEIAITEKSDIISEEWSNISGRALKGEYYIHNGKLWNAINNTYDEPSDDSDDWTSTDVGHELEGLTAACNNTTAAINEELVPCTISQMAITGLDGGSMELYIWDESVRYDQGDIVLLMSTINDSQVMESVWRCLESNTNVRPEKGEYWEYESALKTIHDIGGVKLGKDENGNSGYYNNDGTLTIFAKKDAITSDTWDPTITYTTGQYCIDDNTLWRCLIQNENTKPTEGTYWTRETIANNLITTDGEGNRGYLKADGSFSPFSSGGEKDSNFELVWSWTTPTKIGTRNADNTLKSINFKYGEYFSLDPNKNYMVVYQLSNDLINYSNAYIIAKNPSTLPSASNFKLPDGNLEYIMCYNKDNIFTYTNSTLGDHTGTPYDIFLKIYVYEINM